jgi:hypothetical protein
LREEPALQEWLEVPDLGIETVVVASEPELQLLERRQSRGQHVGDRLAAHSSRLNHQSTQCRMPETLEAQLVGSADEAICQASERGDERTEVGLLDPGHLLFFEGDIAEEQRPQPL